MFKNKHCRKLCTFKRGSGAKIINWQKTQLVDLYKMSLDSTFYPVFLWSSSNSDNSWSRNCRVIDYSFRLWLWVLNDSIWSGDPGVPAPGHPTSPLSLNNPRYLERSGYPPPSPTSSLLYRVRTLTLNCDDSWSSDRRVIKDSYRIWQWVCKNYI